MNAKTFKKKIDKYFNEIDEYNQNSKKKKIATVAGLCVYLDLTLNELKRIEESDTTEGRAIKMAKLKIAEHYENGDLPSSLCVYLNRVNNGILQDEKDEKIDFSNLSDILY